MSKKSNQKKKEGTHGSFKEQFASQGLIPQDQVDKTKESACAESYQHPKKCEIEMTRLPQNTRDVLLNAGHEVPDNFALRLNRWVCFEKDKEKPSLPKYSEKNGSPCFALKYVKGLADKQLAAIRESGLKLEKIEFSIDWRLVVGLGNESVYETSMTLHHVYGFSYIPGSAVKGILRSWIITEVFGKIDYSDSVKKDGLTGAEARALDDEGFRAIFGDTKQVGKIKFFDACPTTKPEIDTDIMNPHFGDYYGDQAGATPPADYLTPVPVSFLTVKNTSFRFVLGINEKENSDTPEDSRLGQGIMLLDVAGRWLKKALTEHGIGAKTAVGYGLMESASKSA